MNCNRRLNERHFLTAQSERKIMKTDLYGEIAAKCSVPRAFAREVMASLEADFSNNQSGDLIVVKIVLLKNIMRTYPITGLPDAELEPYLDDIGAYFNVPSFVIAMVYCAQRRFQCTMPLKDQIEFVSWFFKKQMNWISHILP